VWGIFRQHHYLSAEFNKAATLYLVYWDNILVAMASVLPNPIGTLKYAYRMHRLVVLPDYQALGIGTKINEFIAKLYVDQGDKFYIRTTHLRMIRSLRHNPLWIESVTSGRQLNDDNMAYIEKTANIRIGDKRCAASFEYLGEDYKNKPKIYVKYNGDNVIKFMNYISNLKKDHYVVVVTGKPKESSFIENAMRNLGVRTELSYINLKGELRETNKSRKLIEWNEEE
jgi:hypothetical protein